MRFVRSMVVTKQEMTDVEIVLWDGNIEPPTLVIGVGLLWHASRHLLHRRELERDLFLSMVPSLLAGATDVQYPC